MNPYHAPESALEENHKPTQATRFRLARFRIARFLSFSYLFLAALLCLVSFFKQSQQYNFGAEIIGAMFGTVLMYLLMAAPLYYFLKATKKTAKGGVKKAFRWNVVMAVFLFALCIAVFLPMGRLGVGLASFVFMALPQLLNVYCLFREEDEDEQKD